MPRPKIQVDSSRTKTIRQKQQSSSLVFLSKQPRKEEVLDASKEFKVNQEKIIWAQPFGQELLGFGQPNLI